MKSPLPAVLCVDDDANILTVLHRVLGTRYELTTVRSGADAIAALQYKQGFAVVVSDLHLPDLDGIAVLCEAEQLAPKAVRLLLSGAADLDDAISAINKGHVFRFVSKPVDATTLLEQVGAAVAQHQLLVAEQQLLEQTVQGAVRAMTEMVALTCPAAHGRGTRLQRLVADLAAIARMPSRWEVEVAALLSSLGFVSLPPRLVQRYLAGDELDGPEQAMIDRLPSITEGLLSGIPRFEGVRAILEQQFLRFDGFGAPRAPKKSEILLGARILHIASDFDLLQCRGLESAPALAEMRARPGQYDPILLRQFEETVGYLGPGIRSMDLLLQEVELGMVFGQDVITPAGVLLIARGQDVTRPLLERIQSHWGEFSTGSRLRMIVAAA